MCLTVKLIGIFLLTFYNNSYKCDFKATPRNYRQRDDSLLIFEFVCILYMKHIWMHFVWPFCCSKSCLCAKRNSLLECISSHIHHIYTISSKAKIRNLKLIVQSSLRLERLWMESTLWQNHQHHHHQHHQLNIIRSIAKMGGHRYFGEEKMLGPLL